MGASMRRIPEWHATSALCCLNGLTKGKRDYGQANNLKGLYTDESPGLKVDPVVVLVLSVGFIISVVALHGKLHIR